MNLTKLSFDFDGVLRAGLRTTGLVVLLAALTACNESTSETAQGNAKVFKYEQSLQCQPESGIDLDTMQMELVNAGIDVLCAQTALDGQAHVSVCGGETGRINVYEIRSANLSDAEALDFQSVMMLSDYQDAVCE